MAQLHEAALALITRCDPDIPPLRKGDIPARTHGERGLVADKLAATARDARCVLQAVAVYDAFLEAAQVRRFVAADPGEFARFVLGASTQDAQHLRRNTLLTAHRILFQAGKTESTHPLEDLRPHTAAVPARSPARRGTADPDGRTAQTVIASTDEVLLTRSSTPLARGRDKYRPGAAVAISTADIGLREAPGVCWNHVERPDDICTALDVRGTHLHDPDSLRYQAPRTITLDPSESLAITLWLEEARPDKDSRRSLIYSANGSLTGDSAINSFVKAVNLVREAAALEHSPSVTPTGLALWSAAHTLAFRGLDAACARDGSTARALLNKLGL